jgi:hypothetical protein
MLAIASPSWGCFVASGATTLSKPRWRTRIFTVVAGRSSQWLHFTHLVSLVTELGRKKSVVVG